MAFYRFILITCLTVILCSCALISGLKSDKSISKNRSKGNNTPVSPATGVYKAPSATGENTAAKLIKPVTP